MNGPRRRKAGRRPAKGAKPSRPRARGRKLALRWLRPLQARKPAGRSDTNAGGGGGLGGRARMVEQPTGRRSRGNASAAGGIRHPRHAGGMMGRIEPWILRARMPTAEQLEEANRIVVAARRTVTITSPEPRTWRSENLSPRAGVDRFVIGVRRQSPRCRMIRRNDQQLYGAELSVRNKIVPVKISSHQTSRRF